MTIDTRPRGPVSSTVLAGLLAVLALGLAAALVAMTLGRATWSPTGAAGAVTGGGARAPMMGGTGYSGSGAPLPGEAGFVAGTPASPRVVAVVAGPGYAFTPSSITVAPGETVTFAITSMGGLVHEFMVGPADAVAADREGTPEVADIGMMQTKTLTVTFDGPGPYAYACHAPGHYEAGMRGTISIVG